MTIFMEFMIGTLYFHNLQCTSNIFHEAHPFSFSGSAMYCSSESFDVTCGHNEVILMESAFYGRMHSGRCVSSEYSDSLGCYVDVLQYMDNKCSGKQKCKMLVATLEGVTQPCKKDFKSYLEARHTCIPGELRLTHICGH